MEIKVINAKEVKQTIVETESNKNINEPKIKMKLVQNLSDIVLDNMPENPDSLVVMFPGITPGFPYGDGGICKDKDGKVKGLQTYKNNGISPFTEELGKKYGGENPWILQFNYPNNEEDLFNFDKFIKDIINYIKIQKQERNYNNIKTIVLYGQSMGAKVVLESIPKFIKSGLNIRTIILYAPALTPDFYTFPMNKLNKVPLSLATFVRKWVIGPMVHYFVSKKDPYNWWVELSKKDLSKLAKEVAGYKVLWNQIKKRLEFLSKPNFSYVEKIKGLKNPPKIIVFTSKIPKKGHDGVIISNKVKDFVEKNFPNCVFVEIEGLPHVQTPQAPRLHKAILEQIE